MDLRILVEEGAVYVGLAGGKLGEDKLGKRGEEGGGGEETGRGFTRGGGG